MAGLGDLVLLDLRQVCVEPVVGLFEEEPVVGGVDQQRRDVDDVLGALGLFEVLAQRPVPVEPAGEAALL